MAYTTDTMVYHEYIIVLYRVNEMMLLVSPHLQTHCEEQRSSWWLQLNACLLFLCDTQIKPVKWCSLNSVRMRFLILFSHPARLQHMLRKTKRLFCCLYETRLSRTSLRENKDPPNNVPITRLAPSFLRSYESTIDAKTTGWIFTNGPWTAMIS